jgi:hypothetical protein
MPSDLQPPALVDYLFEKWCEEMSPDDLLAGGNADDFVVFCRKFLEEHLPSLLTNVEGNYVVRLMNGDEVSICPPMPRDGSMQSSGRAIPVTGQDTAREILNQGGP